MSRCHVGPTPDDSAYDSLVGDSFFDSGDFLPSGEEVDATQTTGNSKVTLNAIKNYRPHQFRQPSGGST